MEVLFDIIDAAGRHAGSGMRKFGNYYPDGKLRAVHDHLYLQPWAQGQGIGGRLMANAREVYPELGVSGIRIPRAAEVGRFVRIDMESSDYVQPALDLFEELWQRYKSVGIVIQSYLYRSAGDVARLVDLGASVRLVKGAYDEAPEIALPAQAEGENVRRLIAPEIAAVQVADGGVVADDYAQLS